MAHKRSTENEPWLSRAKEEFEHEEEMLVCRQIVLKIVRYMKDNHLTQKELATRLNVSPQYINKFLHGQDLDLKVSTAVRYGNLLGVKLIEVPKAKSKEVTAMCLYVNYMLKVAAAQPSEFHYSRSFTEGSFSMQSK